ncbi:NADH-quinone oxidoreductase subunit NuoN [Phenylobacterium montanum]|uniref:NADH-quinone oxidoreductase subunit N n=1 Tax=Phenylobacterium montanum TaxID=2823693 RepID=A0A975G0W9_9CAUL|nr:NADH-quinone oxidoreductase subunit NuoN [Caulobacter sp. S6]QUD88508.1 NADH-quinone oxidoreductase subunit NuoN [Caulobacter sp. S6]
MSFSEALEICRPELFLALSAMALLVLGAFSQPRGAGLVSWLSCLALLVAAYLAAVSPVGSAFSGGFVSDEASRFAKVAIYGMSAVGVVLGGGWLGRLNARQFEFPVLIVLAALGMGMMASAGDLISLYVGVELQSLALYILAAFRRDDGKASEAGLKYFVLGALSSGLLLYGASLIYGFAGSVRFPEIAAAVQHGAHAGVIFGLVFLICGLGFKVSAAPFHMWTPDVYEGAPTPVVGFFAAAPKLAAMVLFARALSDAFPGAIEQWRSVVIILAVASMLLGAFAGLVQKNLKRLWAYSSIANVGYALVGMSAGTTEGFQAMLVFMVLYMIDVTGFFACLTALSRQGRPMETIDDMAGLMRERPGMALAMTAFAVSAIGFPPFSGFIAKVFVFRAIIDAGYAWVAVVGLVSSVVAAFYYLRLIKVMWFDAAPGATDAPPADAKAIAYAAALFSMPVVIFAMKGIDPLSKAAAAAFGLS